MRIQSFCIEKQFASTPSSQWWLWFFVSSSLNRSMLPFQHYKLTELLCPSSTMVSQSFSWIYRPSVQQLETRKSHGKIIDWRSKTVLLQCANSHLMQMDYYKEINVYLFVLLNFIQIFLFHWSDLKFLKYSIKDLTSTVLWKIVTQIYIQSNKRCSIN